MKSRLILISIIIILFSSILSAQTPKLKWINGGIFKSIDQYVISPDGKEIAIIDGGNTLKIYNIINRKLINEFSIPYNSKILSYSNDNRSIFIESASQIRKYFFDTGEILKFDGSSNDFVRTNVINKAFSISSDTVLINVFGEYYQTDRDLHSYYAWGTYLYDTKNNITKIIFDTAFTLINNIYFYNVKLNSAMAISPTGKSFAIANDSGYINFYKLVDFNNIPLDKQLKIQSYHVLSLLYNEDGSKIIATDSGGVVSIWNIDSGKLEYSISTKPCKCYLVNKNIIDDKILIEYANRDSTNIDFYYSFNIKTLKYLDSFSIDRNKYINYYFDPNTLSLAYQNENNKKNYRVLYKLLQDSLSTEITPDSTIRGIGFGENCKDWLITSSDSTLIYFQNKNDGRIEKILETGIDAIQLIKVSPDGNILLVNKDTTFQLWSLKNDSLIIQKDIPKGVKLDNLYPFCFSSDSKSFWLALDTNKINKYDCSTGELLSTINLDSNQRIYIKDISINNDDNMAIGIMYWNHPAFLYYDFYDLINNNIKENQINNILNYNEKTNILKSQFLNNNKFFTFSTAFTYDIPIKGEVKSWYLNDFNDFIIFNNYKYNYPPNYKGALGYYVFQNHNIFILYFNDYTLSFYNVSDPQEKVSINTQVSIADMKVDENSSTLYVFSKDGTVKCYDISNEILITDETDVKDAPIEQKELFTLYPNPTNGNIFIKSNYNYNSGISINVINEFGTSVYRNVNSNFNGIISVSTQFLPDGIYFCLINSGTVTESKKFLILK